MSRRKDGLDLISFLIRDVPGDVWRKARVRAVLEDRSIRDALIELLHDYGRGKPNERHERPRRKRPK